MRTGEWRVACVRTEPREPQRWMVTTGIHTPEQMTAAECLLPHEDLLAMVDAQGECERCGERGGVIESLAGGLQLGAGPWCFECVGVIVIEVFSGN